MLSRTYDGYGHMGIEQGKVQMQWASGGWSWPGEEQSWVDSGGHGASFPTL